MNNRTVICWREDSCQQLLTAWRKNGLSAVKLYVQSGHMTRIVQTSHQPSNRQGTLCWFEGIIIEPLR
ncbi:hypothetical protein DET57_10591 [Klebsiella oxytoca]|uniref:Uncharacterized protein n=1 Tax=Klebsiella oxytoca TaxID=571 RepID=A0A318FSP8_KLEOX|nr:hypothetical protein DET57_10591 [Klebsiella oxytoca]